MKKVTNKKVNFRKQLKVKLQNTATRYKNKVGYPSINKSKPIHQSSKKTSDIYKDTLNKKNFEIDISNLDSDIYILKTYSETKHESFKILKN